jgi:hypothetical protein
VDNEPSKTVLQKLGGIAAIEEIVFLKLWGSSVDGRSLWFCRLILRKCLGGILVGLLKCLLAYLPFFPVTRHFWGSGSGPIGILDMLWEKLKAGSRLKLWLCQECLHQLSV